jgi:hypothetical protein
VHPICDARAFSLKTLEILHPSVERQRRAPWVELDVLPTAPFQFCPQPNGSRSTGFPPTCHRCNWDGKYFLYDGFIRSLPHLHHSKSFSEVPKPFCSLTRELAFLESTPVERNLALHEMIVGLGIRPSIRRNECNRFSRYDRRQAGWFLFEKETEAKPLFCFGLAWFRSLR